MSTCVDKKPKTVNCQCSTVDIDKLIFQSKVAEVALGEALKMKMCHDFTCDPDAAEKLDKLQTLRFHLEDELRCRMFGSKGCLNCEELGCMAEQVNMITGGSKSCDLNRDDDRRPDLIVDNSGRLMWNATHPYCIAREKWEFLVYEILCDMKLEISIEDQTTVCDLLAEIMVEELACDIVVAIDVCQRNTCDLDLIVTRKEIKQCELDFEIIIKERKELCDLGLKLHVEKLGCELDLETYVKLVECNLGLEVISTIYEKGCCLEVDGSEVMVHTKSESYPISKIRFTDEPDIQSLASYGLDVESSDYVRDPEKFIEKLNKDYSGK